MTISLPDPMRDFIESEVTAGDYGSASELFREMVRDRQKRKAQERLEALLLEGIESLERGEGIRVTDEYWANRTEKLFAEIERRRKEK
jgi:antitoxin ParD1/3/4